MKEKQEAWNSDMYFYDSAAIITHPYFPSSHGG